MSQVLNQCHSIADLRERARCRLPRVMFDYIDGAAEDEVTMARNSAGFGDYALVPRVLRDVSDIKLDTTIQGIPSKLPLVLSPTGGTRLFHHEGELASSAAAAAAGLIFTLSSMSTYDIETVGANTRGPKWFQIYVWKDRAVVKEFIERARSSGYQALVLTVDVQTSGQRERDLRNGFTLPPKFTLSSLFDMALHPWWWWTTLTKPPITLANVAGKTMGVQNATAMGQYAASQLDPTVDFDDLAWMIQQWKGPFLVKGVTNAQDARRIADIGATGVIVSNHGGRQLDQSIAAIDALPAIVDAVDGKAEVLLDGGVRRGTDIIKALSLGARACMMGRPFLYGLAAGGQSGATRAIDILGSELKRSMMLLGCDDIQALNPSFLQRR
ncbi:MAG: alpha-hydroxy acid oxidase [Pseudohongiellaceae bacterium]